MYPILYVDRVLYGCATDQGEVGLKQYSAWSGISALAYLYALFQMSGGHFGDKLGARLTLIICGLICRRDKFRHSDR